MGGCLFSRGKVAENKRLTWTISGSFFLLFEHSTNTYLYLTDRKAYINCNLYGCELGNEMFAEMPSGMCCVLQVPRKRNFTNFLTQNPVKD